MKTLTVTDARQKLGYWLKRAENGEEIGVLFGASVFALRKVPIQAADYMETEYGLTKEEADKAAERIRAEARDTSDCVSLESLTEVARTKLAPAAKAAARIFVKKSRSGGKGKSVGRATRNSGGVWSTARA